MAFTLTEDISKIIDYVILSKGERIQFLFLNEKQFEELEQYLDDLIPDAVRHHSEGPKVIIDEVQYKQLHFTYKGIRMVVLKSQIDMNKPEELDHYIKMTSLYFGVKGAIFVPAIHCPYPFLVVGQSVMDEKFTITGAVTAKF